ncbi:MAG TPA: DinB family protein [Candidatus Acidoferrum sp.]
MKHTRWLTLLMLVAVVAVSAQENSAPVANPVSTTVKNQLTRFSKNMVAAAESMPAEKYGFKPTPEMNTFGHLVMHIVQSNNLLCSKISGTAAPDSKLADSDGKDKLVAGLKASFEFCSTALANVDDSKLGESMVLFGNRPATRAAALIGLSDGWNDHYGAEAIYLRLNGILPPTAQPAPDKK